MNNIVLFTIDTMRHDSWGCNAAKENTNTLTPFIDSLQDNCIRFTKAYSGGPYTQAAFPGILSSSHYLEYGKTKGKCPKERVLISEVMRSAGYTTAAFHSNAYLCSFFGWNKGWDIFYDSMDTKVTEKIPYVRAWDINKKADNWLKNQKINPKPFFLWVHYMDLHEPYMPEEQYQKEIDPSLALTEDEMFSLYKEVILKRKVDDAAEVTLAKKLYDAHMIEVDKAAKELFASLKEHGFLNNTTVFITADHGEEFAEHGGLSHDGKMFDELVKVPLCIYDASFSGKKVVNNVVSTLDIPPTIAHLVNANADPSWQGQSLLPLEGYDTSCGAYGEAIDKHGPKEKGDEKEVHYYIEGDNKITYNEESDKWSLFNLKDDPEEKHCLINKNTTTEYLMKKIIPRIGRYKNG